MNYLTAKNALTQVTCGIFKRMEEYEESLKNQRTFQRQGSSGTNGVSPETPTSHKGADIEVSITDQNPMKTLSGIMDNSIALNSMGSTTTLEKEVIEKSNENACRFYVVSLIDDICLFEAKKQAVAQKIESSEQEMSEEEKRRNLQAELDKIPERSCPPLNQSLDNRYKHKIPVKVTNEAGNPPGEFGWCVVCRKPADRYCRDLRVPVCNHDCKIKHLQENGTPTAFPGLIQKCFHFFRTVPLPAKQRSPSAS